MKPPSSGESRSGSAQSSLAGKSVDDGAGDSALGDLKQSTKSGTVVPMAKLRVIFYRNASGREPVRDWLRSLDRQWKKIIGDDISPRVYQEEPEDFSERSGDRPPPSGRASRRQTMNPKHLGSDFDSFLEEEGLLEEAEAVAAKRVLAFQIAQAMKEQKLTKAAMARRMKTSRSALDRLLDPTVPSVTLLTIERAVRALGRRLRVEMVEA